jgi:ATPase
MGVIPQVVDTVIFIKGGQVQQILRLKQVVKVPEGMQSEDLARPVIQVYDFYTEEVLYEIYTYGEQVVVVPISQIQKKQTSPIFDYASKYLQNYFSSLYDFPVIVEPEGESSIKIYIPSNKRGQVIGKGGENILDLERSL